MAVTRPVAPGELFEFEAVVVAPSSTGFLGFQWDMVEEGVCWFSQRDADSSPVLVVLVVPALWIFGTYVHELVGAGIGLLFIIARFIYRGAYLNDPSSRSTGFSLGALALVVLMLGGLIGAVMKMMAAQ